MNNNNNQAAAKVSQGDIFGRSPEGLKLTVCTRRPYRHHHHFFISDNTFDILQIQEQMNSQLAKLETFWKFSFQEMCSMFELDSTNIGKFNNLQMCTIQSILKIHEYQVILNEKLACVEQMDIKIKEKTFVNQLITAEEQISALEQAAESENIPGHVLQLELQLIQPVDQPAQVTGQLDGKFIGLEQFILEKLFTDHDTVKQP